MVLLTKYYLVDQTVKDEVGGGCGMHGYKRTASEIWQGSLKEHNYLQELGMDGRVIIQDRQCMYNVTLNLMWF